ncbi:MAG: SRPBCC domain-containing protein [Chloroflexi bacterium]|nr:SRPBCC domain-containing protein [Chloroflexota bacterium]
MTTIIGPLHVRRSGWIAAPPERVWQEFESFERMKAWFGTGHTLTAYEPRVGGMVVTDAGESAGARLLFAGKVLVYDPPRELTFEQDWEGHGWLRPPQITFLLSARAGGTMVELIHHGFEEASRTPGAELNGFESGWDNHHLLRLSEIIEGTPVGG